MRKITKSTFARRASFQFSVACSISRSISARWLTTPETRRRANSLALALPSKWCKKRIDGAGRRIAGHLDLIERLERQFASLAPVLRGRVKRIICT